MVDTTHPDEQFDKLPEINIREGLSSDQVTIHREKYGTNELVPPERDPWWKDYLGTFQDPTIIILSAAAAIAMVLSILQGHFPLDGIAIFVAVFIATGVAFVNEYKASQDFEKLLTSSEDILVNVTRDSEFQRISIKDLVVGDVVHLDMGDRIPADCTIVTDTNVLVDQSLMTGESVPVSKSSVDDADILRGTAVVEGHGIARVVRVGRNTKLGEIADALIEDETKTPLQENLGEIADLINKVGTWTAIAIFLSLALAAIITAFVVKEPVITSDGTEIEMLGLNLGTLQLAVDFFIVAVTIVVVAVPEGLPMAVTVSLALSMRRLTRENVLVRKLVATETIGAATVICSDKTGTLTKNQMKVREVFMQNQSITGAEITNLRDHPKFSLIRHICTINSTGHLEFHGGKVSSYVGNPTEGALLMWMYEEGVLYSEDRANYPIEKQIVFNAQRKMMSTAIQQNGRYLSLVKGAHGQVLDRCASVEMEGGPQPIESHKGAIEAHIDMMAEQSMRTLVLAYKHLDDVDQDDLEENLTMLAVIGIADPVREDVPAALEACHRAGIEVKMVTGDHRITATVIGQQLGLLTDDSIVMDGNEFRELVGDVPPEDMSEDVFEKVNKLRILARAEPLDKLRLVQILKYRREVVAVTGDGTNDAPALRQADVGLAMGLIGTEVAKEASDIILLDDSFTSIERAVHWGRALYENIQKFLQFQLTINVSALAIAFLSPLLTAVFRLFNINIELQTLPLTVLQLLWINLIMDTFAVIALTLEPPTPDMMERPPRGRDKPFITRIMAENILLQSGLFTVVIIVLQATNFINGASLGSAEHLSIIFTLYVMFQVFNEFNCRSLDPRRSGLAGLTKSPALWTIIVITVVVQFLLVQFSGPVFRTTPLSLETWLIITAIASSSLILGEVVRIIRRLTNRTATA